MPELIKMRREEPACPLGPVAADVHPDNVQGYLDAGWVIAEENAPEAEQQAPPPSRRRSR